MLESNVQGLARIIHLHKNRQVKWPINQITTYKQENNRYGHHCFRPTKLGNGLAWYWPCDCLWNSKKHKIRGEGRYKPALGAERDGGGSRQTGNGRGLNSAW